MKTLKQLEEAKVKIEKQIEELKAKENNNYEEVGNFRIYKWENKPVRDFIYPKGYRMAEFQEFVDLIDSGKFNMEVWKYYWVKHFLKEQQKTKYCLSRLCLNWNLYLNSDYDDLAISYDDGRVVCIKEKKA